MRKKAVLEPLEEPSLDYRRRLYDLYVSVFESTVFSDRKKKLILDSLFVGEKWSWRVVGISLDALTLIRNSNFSWTGNGTLQRGHIIRRASTNQLFLNELHNFDNWWNIFWKNDRTEIVTKTENSSEKKSEIIPVDCKRGYFPGTGKIGFRFAPHIEGELCRDLWTSYRDKALGKGA